MIATAAGEGSPRRSEFPREPHHQPRKRCARGRDPLAGGSPPPVGSEFPRGQGEPVELVVRRPGGSTGVVRVWCCNSRCLGSGAAPGAFRRRTGPRSALIRYRISAAAKPAPTPCWLNTDAALRSVAPAPHRLGTKLVPTYRYARPPRTGVALALVQHRHGADAAPAPHRCWHDASVVLGWAGLGWAGAYPLTGRWART